MPVPDNTSAALNGWHKGELAIQRKMGLPQIVPYTAVVNTLPDQHRIFHTTRLHFLPVTTLDEQGRPWASILASAEGKPGFIHSPSNKELEIFAHLWEGDPIAGNLLTGDERTPRRDVLISGVGIELSTRRRNKFAGRVVQSSLQSREVHLKLNIKEALGLCPKYINIRMLSPHPDTSPRIAFKKMNFGQQDKLSRNAIDFIRQADTVYLATSYVAAPEDREKYPSHVGTNHRAGRPGFIRVRNDGRTVVLPNYSGNRMMNSLGNISVTPLAGLVFPSFKTGSIVYLTGAAETLFGEPAQTILPGINVLTTIRTTGCVFVENALPLRQAPGTDTERSPYSPPVRYLAEEKPPEVAKDDLVVTLSHITRHDNTLATFTFEASKPVDIVAGEAAVFSLKDLVHVHAPKFVEVGDHVSLENDDCTRTWTVSIPPTRKSPNVFAITIREIKGGLVTPIMFQIARYASSDIGSEVDVRNLGIFGELRSSSGGHPVLEPIAACNGGRQLLWLAGGIGITPFLSLTRHVAGLVNETYGAWDIVMVVSTREPTVMLRLISDALSALKSVSRPTDLSFVIHLFSHQQVSDIPMPPWIIVHLHPGRVDNQPSFFSDVTAKERECHICGPLPFVQSVMSGLQAAGVNPEEVRRERFTF